MTAPKSIYPALTQKLTPTTSGSTVCSYSNDLGEDKPILTLIHGYPQSAYEWRYIVPHLVEKVSLFVPELPGYGVSTPCKSHSKKAVGAALLEALESVFDISKGTRRKVILGGHDRGARICHRLAVDKLGFENLDIVSAVLMDIVPTKEQWNAFSNPASAVGYWHWPFLANVDIATQLIEAYGGDRWCRYQLLRIQGPNEEGQKRFAADGAHDVYADLFKRRETILCSCEDYASGAAPEVTEQTDDMDNDRKLEIPTMVLYSTTLLGAKLDVPGIWRKWVADGTELKAVGVGNGHGHYFPEEGPEEVISALNEWLSAYIERA